jgi:hypothetical protein
MLQQGFLTQWSVFTPIIYRMMGRQYVDRFFETGELLVSSFDRFRQHPDEERRDKEGRNIICGRGKKQTVFAVTGHGRDAFILCGTAAKDAHLMDAFSADAAIQIYDPTAFASVITRQLPGVRQGFEGFCYYIDGSIECNIGDFELDQLKRTSGEQLDLNRLGGFVLNMAGLAVFFRKALRFRHQLEYRWVWITDHPVTDHLIIHAADARQFCAPLYRDEMPKT